jgi:hypothetical protein
MAFAARLHFWIGTLYRIQLNTGAKAPVSADETAAPPIPIL